MGGSRSPGRKVVVKHTFLEVIDIAQSDQNVTEGRKRSFTDGAILEKARSEAWSTRISSNVGESQTQPDSYVDGDCQRTEATSQTQMHQACHYGQPLHQKSDVCLEAFSQADPVQENGHSFQENMQLGAMQQAFPGLAQLLTQTPGLASCWSQQDVQLCGMGSLPYGAWSVAAVPVPMLSSCNPSGMPIPVPASSSSGRSHTAKYSHVEPTVGMQKSRRNRTIPKAEAPAACSEQRTMVNASEGTSRSEFTTVMLRNLPNQYTRDMLVELLHAEGFASKFNFVYLPVDFKTHAGLGYAFVDLSTPAEAERAHAHFEGFSNWVVHSEKVCAMSWSHPEQQGVDVHIERYRNSPVMHESVQDAWKPAVFRSGVRVPFPPPTRKLRNPRIRMPEVTHKSWAQH